IANETHDEPKHPHVVARKQHLHCKPVAVRDSSDQHPVWCRLHFGSSLLVAGDYGWVQASAKDDPSRHARGRLYYPWDKREGACSSRSAVFWVIRPTTTPSRSTSNARISNWPGSVRSYSARSRPNERWSIRENEDPASHRRVSGTLMTGFGRLVGGGRHSAYGLLLGRELGGGAIIGNQTKAPLTQGLKGPNVPGSEFNAYFRAWR